MLAISVVRLPVGLILILNPSGPWSLWAEQSSWRFRLILLLFCFERAKGLGASAAIASIGTFDSPTATNNSFLLRAWLLQAGRGANMGAVSGGYITKEE